IAVADDVDPLAPVALTAQRGRARPVLVAGRTRVGRGGAGERGHAELGVELGAVSRQTVGERRLLGVRFVVQPRFGGTVCFGGAGRLGEAGRLGRAAGGGEARQYVAGGVLRILGPVVGVGSRSRLGRRRFDEIFRTVGAVGGQLFQGQIPGSLRCDLRGGRREVALTVRPIALLVRGVTVVTGGVCLVVGPDFGDDRREIGLGVIGLGVAGLDVPGLCVAWLTPVVGIRRARDEISLARGVAGWGVDGFDDARTDLDRTGVDR